jgi:hypothetical protein
MGILGDTDTIPCQVDDWEGSLLDASNSLNRTTWGKTRSVAIHVADVHSDAEHLNILEAVLVPLCIDLSIDHRHRTAIKHIALPITPL